MADSSNADSSQESKGATQGASEGSASAQDSAKDSAKESPPAAASAPKASAAPVVNESGEAPAKPAKAAGTSGWKTPSGKPDAKAPTKTSAKAPAKAPAKTTSSTRTTTKTSEKPAKEKQSVDADTIRNWLATAIWTLAVIAALIMAAAALAVSLKFNTDNAIVSFVENTADNLKIFGDFKKFTGSNHQVKNVLVNNGIYAVLYLVVGKILDRLIRP